MKQRKPIAALAPLMILILAGCSDGQVSKDELPAPADEAAPTQEVTPMGDEATSVTVATLVPADAGASAAASEASDASPVIQVSIRGMAFRPARIDIRAGTTVTWKNYDDVPHTVTATDRSWDSGVIPPGGTFSRRFDGAGTFAFFCVPHPDMTGSVVVRASE